ncbi:hypothetical protein NQ318_021548 [Aromia moschata]|uniref:Uncharacterized protein n=1 Tax=Aromia moschata TaxID=1265417 RepID=A0AAV8ZC95_9CUCU|nr:hypothetical protein NQ318_021548 [Aromia moschata]
MCSKVCAKIVSKLLTSEQKESIMNIYADILNNIDTVPDLLDTVITCEESRVKAKATEVLNELTEADFQQWKSRMERCRDHQGEYIEGEKVATNLCATLRLHLI